MQARRDALREVGGPGRRGERHGEEDGREEREEGGGGLEVARETWGIAEVFSVFTYKGLNVGHGMLGVDGVAGGWLRTTGFSSVIIAEQQQSDDLTLVYGTLRVGSRSVCESRRDDRKGFTLVSGKDTRYLAPPQNF